MRLCYHRWSKCRKFGATVLAEAECKIGEHVIAEVAPDAA